ncbi:MAG: hypothetical protein AB7S75_06885 [Desulfococcaceae bacterium]
MDPVTAGILAAIAAGATQVGKSAIVDSYTALKKVIGDKYRKSQLPAVVNSLEAMPDSKNRQGTVQEEIQITKADKDPEILKALENLAEALKASPEGQKVISKYNLNITGSKIGVVGDNVKIEGGMHF